MGRINTGTLTKMLTIETKLWKDGYIQSGRGDEISIILRNDEGKMQQRIVFSADLLESLKQQINNPLIRAPKGKLL